MSFKMLISQFEIGFLVRSLLQSTLHMTFSGFKIIVNILYLLTQNLFENNKIDIARNEHRLSNVYCLCRMLSLLENISYADI